MELCGKELRIKGKVVRIASLDGEGYQFLEDPEAALGALRNSRTGVDLFTFIQRLCETLRYSYPTEWDNLAVLPIHRLFLDNPERGDLSEGNGVLLG